MLGAIADIAGRLLGTQKAGERILESATKALDVIVYTEEEKAEARMKVMDLYMKWLESTSGSRVARRLIAATVLGIWAFKNATATIYGVYAITTDSEVAKEVSEYLTALASEDSALVGTIMLFYFGGPAAIDAAKAMILKWSKTNESKAGA